MAFVDDVTQKLKGKGQKLRGRMRTDRVGGSLDEIKGTINESIADAKLRSRGRTRRSRNIF